MYSTNTMETETPEERAQREKEKNMRAQYRSIRAKINTWNKQNSALEVVLYMVWWRNYDDRNKARPITGKSDILTRVLSHASYPQSLRVLASIVLTTPVSNANCERVFSHLKNLYRKNRLSLSTKMVNSLMFLGINDVIPKYDADYFRFQK